MEGNRGRRLYVINSFVREVKGIGGGNPAAVVLFSSDDEVEVSDAGRQAIAKEMNLSETAFVSRIVGANKEENEFRIRWFTPAMEVDLCGHATLAAAAAVLQEGWVASQGGMKFHTNRKGVLAVKNIRIPGTSSVSGYGLEMKFPTLRKRIAVTELENELLKTGLGLKEEEIVQSFRSDYDMVVQVRDSITVGKLKARIEVVERIDCRGIIVAGRWNGEGNVRFGSRFFAPRAGIEEDPVTGSAHCVLADMFVEVGEANVRAVQMSERGGLVLVGRPDEDSVTLGGTTRTLIRGDIYF